MSTAAVGTQRQVGTMDASDAGGGMEAANALGTMDTMASAGDGNGGDGAARVAAHLSALAEATEGLSGAEVVALVSASRL